MEATKYTELEETLTALNLKTDLDAVRQAVARREARESKALYKRVVKLNAQGYLGETVEALRDGKRPKKEDPELLPVAEMVAKNILSAHHPAPTVVEEKGNGIKEHKEEKKEHKEHKEHKEEKKEKRKQTVRVPAEDGTWRDASARVTLTESVITLSAGILFRDVLETLEKSGGVLNLMRDGSMWVAQVNNGKEVSGEDALGVLRQAAGVEEG